MEKNICGDSRQPVTKCVSLVSSANCKSFKRGPTESTRTYLDEVVVTMLL